MAAAARLEGGGARLDRGLETSLLQVLGERLKHWSGWRLEERQGNTQHTTLEGGIVWDSQGAPELEGDP